MIISRLILLRVRNVSDKAVEKIKTHSMFSNFFPPKIVPLMWQCKKYGEDRQATANKYDACALYAG